MGAPLADVDDLVKNYHCNSRRLCDMLRRKTLLTIKLLVLDEADEVLDVEQI